MAKKLSKLEIISRLKKIDWIEFDETTIVDNRTYFTVKCKKHYKPIKQFGGEVAFKKQLIRDLEVEEYCKEKNYPLLIIPYDYSNNNIEKLIK